MLAIPFSYLGVWNIFVIYGYELRSGYVWVWNILEKNCMGTKVFGNDMYGYEKKLRVWKFHSAHTPRIKNEWSLKTCVSQRLAMLYCWKIKQRD